MAVLDTRLLPLIETLTVAGADWLAFEILDGLQLGRALEETQNTLHDTRHAVRSAERPMRRSEERAEPPPTAVPILGNEQIQWAADYVGKRMSEVVSMLQATLIQLDGIVAGASNADVAPPASATKGEITLVLQTQEEAIDIRRAQAADAMAVVPKLQEALRAWVLSTRGRP